MADDAIEIEGLKKRFRKRTAQRGYTTIKTTLVRNLLQRFFEAKRLRGNYLQAIDGIDLNVRRGTTLGIIGPNGSGKSTLLKLVTGIYKPDSGRIQIHGRVSALIELGAGFHPEFSGRENIFLNGIVLGLPKRYIEKQFDAIVDFADLRDFIDDPVRTYSSGMYMRLGFSIAIHVDPDILLIDEVLAVGDEAFIHKCQEKVADFKRRGKTILVVTHDLGAVERWCDDVVLLGRGRIVERGTARWVIDRYRKLVAEAEAERLLDERHRAEQATAARAGGNGETVPIHLNEVAAAEQVDPNRQRWGTREIEIVGVKILDASDAERYVYAHGEPATIEIRYAIHKRVAPPVFGIGLFTPTGVCCYGSNTRIDRVPLSEIPDRGRILCRVRNLDFVDGEYLLDVAVHAEDGYAYDYHTRLVSFAVRTGVGDTGVFRPAHEWGIEPDGPAVPAPGTP